MNEQQLIESIKKSKFRIIPIESASMIKRMNKTKKRVELIKIVEKSNKIITISSGI